MSEGEKSPEESPCGNCGNIFPDTQLGIVHGNKLCVDCAKLLLEKIQGLAQARRKFWELEEQDEDYDDA